jgi:hypothetical protein
VGFATRGVRMLLERSPAKPLLLPMLPREAL